MVLVLAIGDTHIPSRSTELPAKFKKLLVPGKIQQILCTGNITSRATLDFLRSVAAEIVPVRGDADEIGLGGTYPQSSQVVPPSARVVVHGPLKVGLIHGHDVLPWGDADALAGVARHLDADVMVTGHTHRFEAYEYEGRFFVNPGSATGAFSHLHSGTQAGGTVTGDTPNPSFVLMDLQGPSVVLYVYQLVEGELKIEKVDWTKKEQAAL
ncbi:Metallo-dependent phosphatase [Gonapodya prolifera JEL478]|uniref:Vacuolar protein sorting-associated protein 29 n=1 Tax=Gonapodya prolifera (strain JEL478) TaxID=1344416 RepID=A0A139A9Q0_GONPJ|nr:Metallo-dependent phosphatase [Gonapodya prolifera JEL478]|eukprot:KXS13195.1 Metallo-dependent phosphatase [Gonapodya prolifera JEL478]